MTPATLRNLARAVWGHFWARELARAIRNGNVEGMTAKAPMNDPNEIVGHKTFSTGEIGERGFPALRHEPLTRAEADALWEASEAARRDRTARMPDEKSAIHGMWDGWQRLKELGWREAMYCPKDGTHFQVIEVGSTGIHDANYQGEWPNGSFWLFDGDIWPSDPVLFKLYPEDQAKEDARMAANL